MTGKEIKAHAERHTEYDQIQDNFALAMINECILMDLGKDACAIGTAEIEVGRDAWHDLADDVLEIFEIAKKGREEPYLGRMYGASYQGDYDIKEGQIRFPQAGAYAISYYRVPAPMDSLNDIPAVHAALHYPMSLYVAARFKAYDDEENPDAQRLMNDYFMYREKALNEISKTRPSTGVGKRIKVGAWR